MNIENLAWDKMQGLLPAIVQDAKTQAVLMLGYMNQAALQKTLTTKWVTFYSRSRNALWVKGETSGNKLELVTIVSDCDNDTLLITANPIGATCHTGTTTCFGEPKLCDGDFIQTLEKTIQERYELRPEGSYTTQLFSAGISRIAQKIGEEGVEVALAAIEKSNTELCGEIADLLFHVLVLLRAKNLNFADVLGVLKARSHSE